MATSGLLLRKQMPEKQVEFSRHRVTARRDLLYFVAQQLEKDIHSKIGQNPRAWLEELGCISSLKGDLGLGGSSGLHQPPIGDQEFKALGNGAYIYGGKERTLKGLWLVRKDEGKGLENLTSNASEWIHYNLGSTAILSINPSFSDIPIEKFLPENFEAAGQRVQKNKGEFTSDKRPIFRFEAEHGGRNMGIYAKGAYVTCSYYYEDSRPSYRLTPLASVNKISSKREAEITLKLAGAGVKFPEVLGTYEGVAEEFMFLAEAVGKTPDHFVRSHRPQIIEQDATMLARLCLAGFRKQGFADFDDKVFDGKDLYLIDAEECEDLYRHASQDFREMVVNPRDRQDLRRFRKVQRAAFMGCLKDALFLYRKTLAPSAEDQRDYIQGFYSAVGWRRPGERDIAKLTHFPENYMTFDSWMSMMCDTD